MMNEIEKERRCKSCGKLLINEKIWCRRCKLKMRNTGVKLSGIISALVVATLNANSLANDGEGKNDASSPD